MGEILHKDLTGADLHEPKVHAISHQTGGSDEITGLENYESMIRAGQVFTCRLTTKNNTFISYPANIIRTFPIYFQRDVTVHWGTSDASIWWWYGNASAVGIANNCYIGIYASDANYYPTTRLYVSSYSMPTGGWKGIKASFTFKAGQLYWIAYLQQYAEFIAQWNSEYLIPSPLQLSAPPSAEYRQGWELSYSFANLPDPFSTGATMYHGEVFLMYFTKA